jgi:hypothetical protein
VGEWVSARYRAPFSPCPCALLARLARSERVLRSTIVSPIILSSSGDENSRQKSPIASHRWSTPTISPCGQPSPPWLFTSLSSTWIMIERGFRFCTLSRLSTHTMRRRGSSFVDDDEEEYDEIDEEDDDDDDDDDDEDDDDDDDDDDEDDEENDEEDEEGELSLKLLDRTSRSVPVCSLI